jgi:hypothetical protein
MRPRRINAEKNGKKWKHVSLLSLRLWKKKKKIDVIRKELEKKR